MLKPSMPNMVVNQPVNLSKEQMRVLDIVKQGFSVFFTGSAGTGKSFLLRRIIGKRKVSFAIVNEESLKSKHGILHNKHPQIMYGDIYQNL